MRLLLFVRISNEVANEDAKAAVVSVGSLIAVFCGGRCLSYLLDVSQTDLASLHAQKSPFMCSSMFNICTTMHMLTV